MMETISFFISLFVISAGAILVAIASILHLAWLAVVIPLLIAAGAALRSVRVRPPRGTAREPRPRPRRNIREEIATDGRVASDGARVEDCVGWGEAP